MKLTLLTRPFTAPAITRGQAIRRMERISALTHLMASVEHLARPEFRRPGGLNNWAISRESSALQGKVGRPVLDVVGRPDVTTALHGVRIAAALLGMAPGGGRRRHLATDATLALTSLALHPRHHYGTDGSDQVAFLAQAAGVVARSTRSAAVQDAALWAVGLQGTLSYAVSGWVKIAGPSWRQGRALEGVTRTMTYGDQRTWQLVRRHPRLGRVVGVGVLALECAAPLAYAARGRLATPYTLATAGMHLGIARTMALGRFVPAFTSMHPPMLYTARPRVATADQPGGVRDDTVVRLAGALAVAAAATGIAAAVRTRRHVRAGHVEDRVLDMPDGARLAYRRREGGDGPGPVFLFENALLGTPEHWEWIVQELLERGATVVTYQRAGYGPSTEGAPGQGGADGPGADGTGVDGMVGHAAVVAAAVAGDRELVLVGHSLGGLIALRAAAALPGRVRAVVLVDSSHPDELRRSPRQAAGADVLTAGFPMLTRSLAIGCGLLLPVPDWVQALPPVARSSALDQYRDTRMWRAGRREWAATLEHFAAEQPLPRLDVPVLVLSAQSTVLHDSAQRELHQDLVTVGSVGSRQQVVRDANHDSIVTDGRIARRVARHIDEFVREAGAPGRSVVAARDAAQDSVVAPAVSA